MELHKLVTIKMIKMHTRGEPVHIAVSGYPEIIGDMILDKQRYCKEKLGL